MAKWGWNPYLSDFEAVLLISVLGTHLSIHSEPYTHQGHVLRRQTHSQVIPIGILPSSYLQKAHWATSFEWCPQTHTTTQYGLKQNHPLSSKHLFSSDHGTTIIHIKQVWNCSHIYLTLPSSLSPHSQVSLVFSPSKWFFKSDDRYILSPTALELCSLPPASSPSTLFQIPISD